MNSYLLVFLGGGLGSVLRYGLGRILSPTLFGSAFPLSILLVNVVASGVLGLVMGWTLARSAPDTARLLLGIGLCGGLSTFSSFSYDTVVLLQSGRVGAALLNVGLNLILCLAVTGLGLFIAHKNF